ncbi:MAG TPA: hypothetical protein VFM05_00465 [Candidatus Saccharimonadales bacterium]|nr:hypothetical protein [Candidatus Saccharimonadales bacterium]
MQEIFEKNRSEFLRGAIVWTPMLPADNLEATLQRELMFADALVRQFWDPERILGRLLSQTLNITISIAWDVYLLYPPDHPWNAELPPAPEFWMHQQDEEISLYLDPSRFKAHLQSLLERTAFDE